MCLAAGCGRQPGPDPESIARLEFSARSALSDGDPQRAATLAEQILKQAPDSVPALVVAGFAAASLGRVDEALELYSRIPDDANPRSLEGRCLLAQLLLFDKGRAADAEQCYRRVLHHDSDHALALQGLATLMEVEGRRHEMIPLMLRALRAGRIEAGNLLAIGWVQLPSADPEVLKRCRSAVPDDPLPLLGLARIAVRENDAATAETLLRELVQARPDQLEAQTLLGRILVDSPDRQAWQRWHRHLPPAADDLAETWFVRGLRAEQAGNSAAAVRSFGECCRRDPDHPEASFRLSRHLRELGKQKQSQVFLDRSRQLERLGEQLSLLHVHRNDAPAMEAVAATLESLGRIWEAWGWFELAATLAPSDVAQEGAARLRSQLRDAALIRTQPAQNPATTLDLASFPMPDFDAEIESGPASRPLATRGAIRFEDQASAAGIDFQYFNGRAPGAVGLRLHESMGGGVAVLDFDGDDWPDIYLTQGCDWKSPRPEHTDRLYRNLGNCQFSDVTAAARLGDPDFSQGAAAGDINHDGFADLYVANAGANRLYRNNGDGTFTDISAERGGSEHYWTTSAAIADLNADGLPDLYDCTYVGGPEAYTRLCPRKGMIRTCSPLEFPAERDRLYLNLGDGRFQEIGNSAGITAFPGKGLGVVVADLDGSGRLSIFVANDLEANSLFVNQSAGNGSLPQFIDQGLQRGLALDGGGRAQACMGVAAGDADGDGRLDLFVTNYHLESNTLYRQLPGGLFDDGTRSALLRDPGFAMLGFGTQFLDADLDGAPDLVVANGHLDDFTHEGIPFQMPPQFFHNGGTGQFAEVSAPELGDYFRQNCLGRGLARLDWNRDGREDFAVSHLDRPFALVTNRTPGPGKFLGLVLHGVRGSRDAIGATLEATIGSRRLSRQLTGGDGYMACNQRELILGLGESEEVDRLTIRWPSGAEQSFRGLRANQRIAIVENRPVATILTGSR